MGLMAVARRDNKGKKDKNALPGSWDSDLKGDIVLFRVDDGRRESRDRTDGGS